MALSRPLNTDFVAPHIPYFVCYISLEVGSLEKLDFRCYVTDFILVS